MPQNFEQLLYWHNNWPNHFKKNQNMKNIIYLILFISTQSFAQDMINETINYDGNLREYSIYVPPLYDGSISVPLLFNFHGGAGDITGHLYTSDMRPIADTANFIAVYPQALGDPNDDYSANWMHKDPTDHDDVFFIETLIETISSQYSIDQKRIYVCGYSLGGEFTYDLLCRLNNKIASGAAVARTMQQYTYDICAPVHPTAVMTILGTDDSTSPYEGVVFDGGSYYVSADDMHAYWSTYNNTDSSPVEIDLPNISLNDGSTVQRRSWINGDNCVSVEELKVYDGGHDWPGAFGNMDIFADEEIWNFVSKHNIDGLIDCESLSIIEEGLNIKTKELLKTINLLGQEVKYRNSENGEILFKIYDDGSVEKCLK
jgi:poly(3-hydroxybutyrate) depolymerase